MRFGLLDIHIVRDAAFRLDGGAMFGVVPKVLWERKFPADAKNRIGLATNCLLVRGGGSRRSSRAASAKSVGRAAARDVRDRDDTTTRLPTRSHGTASGRKASTRSSSRTCTSTTREGRPGSKTGRRCPTFRTPRRPPSRRRSSRTPARRTSATGRRTGPKTGSPAPRRAASRRSPARARSALESPMSSRCPEPQRGDAGDPRDRLQGLPLLLRGGR